MNDIGDDIFKVICGHGESASEDLDCAEMGAIGWTLLVLATVAVKIDTADLLR